MTEVEQTPQSVDPEDEKKRKYYEANQWQLMSWRFAKHRIAFWCAHIILLFYIVFLNGPFFAPYDPVKIHNNWVSLPPQVLHFGFVEGKSLPRFYVHPYKRLQNPVTLKRIYQVDTDKRTPLQFLVKGHEWKFLGLFPSTWHLFGTGEDGQDTAFLMGTGKLGQDVFSRILYGGRISLLLGLCGVTLSFFLGISLGGVSGFYGGLIDQVIQRIAEILQSVPKIPLWLALSAAIPKDWSSLQVYFGMTLILACMGWTGMCRTVRGKLLALREEEYAKAALLAGAPERRIIYIHLIPNFLSHIIVSLSMAIPGMIMAETGLSFLGLGLRPPTVSWGVLLQEANVDAVINQPWLLLPALFVIVAVLAFNFTGEGMRDAADPYA